MIYLLLIFIVIFWLAGIISLYVESPELVQTKKDAILSFAVPFYAIYIFFGGSDIFDWWDSLK